MNKFTLFILSVCTIIVVIVAELLVSDYLKTPNQAVTGSANVLQAQSSTSGAPAAPAATDVPSSTPNQSPSAAAPIGSIYSGLLKKVGLGVYDFKVIPFDGKLFGSIAFTDLNFFPTYESYLTKDQIASVATFYEFNPGSIDSATQFYLLVKQKCSNADGVILNETNSFADASFYANFIQYPQRVFLVFRKGTRVFAFTYNKDLHGDMVSLIGLL